MAAGVSAPSVACVYLRSGRDGPVRGGNPWIFSQAIARAEPADVAAGTLVRVMSSGGDLLGLGYINLATTIAVRMLAWGQTPDIGELIARRLDDALALRRRIIASGTDCYRMLNGDGDGLSGIVVDRYGEVLVVQLLTAGADKMRELIVRELERTFAPRAIIERSIGAVRKQEGLTDHAALLRGDALGNTTVIENGLRIFVDFEHGQKTGCFLDQRDSRALACCLAAGARMLDACCYGGGFAIAALKGGATHAVAIDTSARALGWARQNLALNAIDSSMVDFVHDEAGKFMATTDQRFDLIVLDPPPLARSRADTDRAGRLYVELNALAMRALAPGGRMLTFSCSAHFRGEDFVRAVRIAASKAGRPLRMLSHLGPGADHPVLLGHAEGEYLTGLLLADLN
jgi:23S rRNA (cytosine1962-C5)-methyltransferase